MDINAKLIEKYDTIEISSTFKKREFVVEYAENPSYPEFVKFEAIQDKCQLLDNIQVGQEIEVHFNLKGRKWVNPKGETVYFNALQAWKILSLAGNQTVSPEPVANATPAQNSGLPPVEAYNASEAVNEDDDDVPF